MEPETDAERQARYDGQDGEYKRWLAAFEKIGFTLHPGMDIEWNLRQFGEWWKRQPVCPVCLSNEPVSKQACDCV